MTPSGSLCAKIRTISRHFDERAAEPILTYEELLNDLKTYCKL